MIIEDGMTSDGKDKPHRQRRSCLAADWSCLATGRDWRWCGALFVAIEAESCIVVGGYCIIEAFNRLRCRSRYRRDLVWWKHSTVGEIASVPDESLPMVEGLSEEVAIWTLCFLFDGVNEREGWGPPMVFWLYLIALNQVGPDFCLVLPIDSFYCGVHTSCKIL